MKKFYHLVSTSRHDDGYAILLDGKPVKTPDGALLLAPTEVLATLLMTEWTNQKDEIDPASMPMTQLLTTLLDRTRTQRDALQTEILQYLDTDLVCYRSDDPPEIGQAQSKLWDPVLDWFAERFGVSLLTTTGLSPLRQEQGAHDQVKAYVEDLSDARFTILQVVTAESGSLLVALGFMDKRFSPEDVFAIAQVEEDFKAELYHEDEHGRAPDAEKKRKSLIQTLRASNEFLGAL